ncbi:MAG: HAD-IIA family hydrolase [Victivallaceae bacterium]
MKFIDFFRANRDSYQALLLDVDGTICTGSRALPGAAELLAELKLSGYPHLILTNDGNHSPEEKSELLRRGGLPVSADEIVSCGAALKEVSDVNGYAGKTFFVLGRLGVPCFAERAGLRVCRDPGKIEECFGVINGEDYYDWHDHMQAVINYFRRHPDRPYLVPNPDSYWPSPRTGDFGIGAGGQARFIASMLGEMGVEVTPTYLGKPYRPLYDYSVHLLHQRFGLPEPQNYRKILMAGDSLQSDVRGANRCGMTSALLLTGITDAERAARAEGETKPQYIFESIN